LRGTGRRTKARLCSAAILVVHAVLSASPAPAQFGETAEVTRPIPATNPLDATAAGTEVRVRDRIVPQNTDQLIQESAGTRVVAAGARGTPFCLRIRGAACDQVTVMLDDVPISGPDTGFFDLSLVPLEAIDGFEIYRGGTPAWLNDGSIGGVMRLLPRTYDRNEVGARGTYGSFGTWSANAFGAAATEKVELFATAGAGGARNDFAYLDRNGTLFDPTDDVERTRENADFLQGFGFGNLAVETSPHSQLRLVFLGLGRERGAPGPASSPALQARANQTRLLGSAAWLQAKQGKHPYRLQVVGNYDFGRNRLTDDLGEIGRGGPSRTDDKTHAVFGRVASSVLVVPWLELTTIASARFQLYDPDSELRAEGRASDRVTVAGTLETRFFGKAGRVALELRPSVRLSWTRVEIREPQLGSAVPLPGPSSDLLPTFRVGAAIGPLQWLAFRGSVANGYRLPSLFQLFGNRFQVESSPNLIPERALSVDGAVTARGAEGIVNGYVSVGAFASWVDNMIRVTRTGGGIVYQNIDSGRTRGVEIELRGGVTEHFVLLGDLTWTQAVDEAAARPA
jgi:outer membrane receptor protein involved in Fe transport